MAKLTYENAPRSSMLALNVSLDGEPFGAIWSWPNTPEEWHPWHAQPLMGEHKCFNTLDQARAYMEECT